MCIYKAEFVNNKINMKISIVFGVLAFVEATRHRQSSTKPSRIVKYPVVILPGFGKRRTRIIIDRTESVDKYLKIHEKSEPEVGFPTVGSSSSDSASLVLRTPTKKKKNNLGKRKKSSKPKPKTKALISPSFENFKNYSTKRARRLSKNEKSPTASSSVEDRFSKRGSVNPKKVKRHVAFTDVMS